MNLSPAWVIFLAENGYEAVHWSKIGAGNAPDEELMSWAITHKHIVFTEDLDFSELIALTKAKEPSILQIRSQDNLPDVAGSFVLTALNRFKEELELGAIVVLDRKKSRARILPFVK
jgi:predicted nuclease of predicted toxin-antitoxin system